MTTENNQTADFLNRNKDARDRFIRGINESDAVKTIDALDDLLMQLNAFGVLSIGQTDILHDLASAAIQFHGLLMQPVSPSEMLDLHSGFSLQLDEKINIQVLKNLGIINEPVEGHLAFDRNAFLEFHKSFEGLMIQMIESSHHDNWIAGGLWI